MKKNRTRPNWITDKIFDELKNASDRLDLMIDGLGILY